MTENTKKINLKCIHEKRKTYCKDCGGGGLCEHDKPRHYCKDCDGNCLCKHEKRKYRCKECNGSSLCNHGVEKYGCKECGKHNILCIHEKRKSHCKECGGIGICEHSKRKTRCIECRGSELCIHKIRKSICKECKGNSLCNHNKVKTFCKECNGGGICLHNRVRSSCKDCNGGSLCKHQKQKPRCKECGGSELCKNKWCEVRKNRKYEEYCMPCFVNNPENKDKPAMRNYKTKENEVVFRIKETFPDFTWITDKKIEDGCSKRRPDLLLDMGSHIIIVEVDENKHTDYDCSCEHKRLMEISQDLGHRPIIFIRFNPDSYKNENGILIKSCWKLNKLGVMTISKKEEWNYRIECLKEQINYWINNPTEKTIEIVELFY